jgi:drug/metabolite transporter (DMT)-like permease
VRLNSGFLGWGVFLVIAGAILLAIRAGLITPDQVGQVGSLWPVIIIGIGVGVLLLVFAVFPNRRPE